MATNANELPYTSNPSLFLLGYLVYYDQIRELQTQFRYGNPTQAGQIAIQNAIIANVEQQFCTLKDLFVENSKCDKCQQPAMVTGSVHQNFSNAATQAIWDELVHGVNGKFPFHSFPVYPLE